MEWIGKANLSFSCLAEAHFIRLCHSNSLDECAEVKSPGHVKMCLTSYANNKGADQPANPHSLISAFVVRCIDSIISLDSIAEISRL